MPVFATIIHPDAAGAFGHWQQRIKFGDRLASERSSGFSHLEVDDATEAGLFAGFAGKVSTHAPTGFLRPAAEAIDADDPSTTLTLYLAPTTSLFDPEWQALASVVSDRFSASVDATLKAESVGYLVYRNVDAAAAKAALCHRIKTKRGTGACNDALWKRFVAGDGFVTVRAGDRLGDAGPAYLPATPQNRLQCAVGLRTRYGMFDPGTFYSAMTSTAGVQSPTHAWMLAALFGQALPLIAAVRTVADVGNDRLWPWPALVQYKHARALKFSEWRQLGDLQKQKYRKHLLARIRPGGVPQNTVRFDFDVDDMSNVFQLEAVTEFYMNLKEPWDPAAQPIAPGTPGYTAINLLSLYGSAAQVNGAEVTLDDQLDLARDMDRISTGRDTLLLESESLRPGKQFRVMDVSGPQKVTVDKPPQLGSATSAWRMFDSPTLVQIDAFGSRVRGARALVGAAPTTVRLESLTSAQLKELERVNVHDTIAFATVAGGAGAARITATPTLDAAAANATVQLDRAVSLPAAGSAWAIPAGVGGVQGFLREKPKRPASKEWGWDHFDGMLFVVGGGEVRGAFPFSSYTSRKLDNRKNPTRYHSSIKGNRRYRFASVFSRKLYINVAFSVIDLEALPRGRRHTPSVLSASKRLMVPDVPLDSTLMSKWGQNIYFIQAAPPRFRVTYTPGPNDAGTGLVITGPSASQTPATSSPYWALSYDGVREARYYFKPGFDNDSAGPGQKVPYGKDELGKGGIRIHLSGHQVAESQGCQVSPHFVRLRMALITYHLASNATYYQENQTHAEIDHVGKMHSEQPKPPLVLAFQGLTEKRKALEQRIATAVSDPLAAAIDQVTRAGGDDASRLEALRALNEELQAKLRVVEDSADTPSQDQIVPVLHLLTEQALEDDVQTLVEWARAHAEEIARLKQEVVEIDEKLDDECKRWGWNDAIHGDYWLIRPDERAV